MKCYMHPATDAIGTCTVCGRGVCMLDSINNVSGLICRDCNTQQPRAQTPPPYQPAQPQPVMGAYPPMGPPPMYGPPPPPGMAPYGMPPPMYGYPGMMMPADYYRMQEAKKYADLGLILGIIGFFIGGIILGPCAIYCGIKARSLDPSKGMGGIILGAIVLIFGLGSAVFMLLMLFSL